MGFCKHFQANEIVKVFDVHGLRSIVVYGYVAGETAIVFVMCNRKIGSVKVIPIAC